MGWLLHDMATHVTPSSRLPETFCEAESLLGIKAPQRNSVWQRALLKYPGQVITKACLKSVTDESITSDTLAVAPKPSATPWTTSDSCRWWTPLWILVLVRTVFGVGIDLDPFSERKCNRERVRANKYYSENHDGYSRVNPWFKKVFANPPGGTTNGKSNMGRALKRAVKEYEEGNIECCILVLKVAVGYHCVHLPSLDDLCHFLMFSEAFQQLTPKMRDDLGINSTRLSCSDRACNGFEIALRLEVQSRLEVKEVEEAIFLVVAVTILSSYEWLQRGRVAQLVGGDGPFHWPRRKHAKALEEELLKVVNKEAGSTKDAVLLTDYFGMTPTPWGFGAARNRSPGVLEPLLPEGHEVGTAVAIASASIEQLRVLCGDTPHGIFRDKEGKERLWLTTESISQVDTSVGVQDFMDVLGGRASALKPFCFGELWANVLVDPEVLRPIEEAMHRVSQVAELEARRDPEETEGAPTADYFLTLLTKVGTAQADAGDVSFSFASLFPVGTSRHELEGFWKQLELLNHVVQSKRNRNKWLRLGKFVNMVPKEFIPHLVEACTATLSEVSRGQCLGVNHLMRYCVQGDLSAVASPGWREALLVEIVAHRRTGGDRAPRRDMFVAEDEHDETEEESEEEIEEMDVDEARLAEPEVERPLSPPLAPAPRKTRTPSARGTPQKAPRPPSKNKHVHGTVHPENLVTSKAFEVMNTYKNDTDMAVPAPATARDPEEAAPEWIIPGVVKDLHEGDPTEYTATLKRHGHNWIILKTKEEFAKYGLAMPPPSSTHTAVVIMVCSLPTPLC
ncbi:hypothetical protein CYMTET_11824 [Cymbomonas tetramitiformis]|uniref:Uncharacterized protein n=1 Tax=Cymbomonas tetramitiformis TaxID=36881 RepID=A0AAE0LCS6_9CHLO|nr:hypothetical protein CYMTET_11824 [Cymbomonas tetramitiformis]